MINEQTIRAWCARFHDYARAATATAHLADPGHLQLVSADPAIPRPRQIWFHRFEIGDHVNMANRAIEWAEQGRLVWIEPRTIRQGTTGRGETVWVLALVIDYDGYGVAPIPESFSVQTSPGHTHHWYMTSLSPEPGKQIGARLRAAAEADDDTGVISQPYLLPGVPNFPTFEKIKDGRRTTVAGTFIRTDNGPTYLFEDFDRLLPPMHSRINSLIPTCLPSASSRTMEELDAKFCANSRKGPIWLAEPTGVFWPNLKNGGRPDRDDQFRKACWQAFRAGLSPDDLYNLVLAKYRNGCAANFFEKRMNEQAGRTFMWNEIMKSHEGFRDRGDRTSNSNVPLIPNLQSVKTSRVN